MAEIKQVLVPDIGDFKNIPVIELLVKPGDTVKGEDPLISLESDKATMEVPSPFAGVVKEINVREGDKVSEGALILIMEVNETDGSAAAPPLSVPVTPPTPAATIPNLAQASNSQLVRKHPIVAMPGIETAFIKAHASPSVRRFARELGVNLDLVSSSGPKQRILKEDVKTYVKAELSKPLGSSDGVELNLLPWPQVDFAKFGPVELKSLLRIKKMSGANLHRNWVMIPHVTQFDEADITDLEVLRKEFNETVQKGGIKLTILAFLMQATIVALKKFPDFNASLDRSSDDMNLVIKNYYHLGFAVDTSNGLMVPVIRDVDQKGVVAIAEELGNLAVHAREGKLKPTEMQGASFTISSLGGIGGTAFTPIINAPEVAILGVSRASIKPVYRDGQFAPRLMLPLSLSYDHRVIDGASAARFTAYMVKELANIPRTLL
ncbi:MAG: dihydrolipoyllysine-residue acetyltransferase [Betaproteobacteria bacterium]|nr:MAG: dihydrolipoyllysine-residue acetyltransferase [Betaproteobacteria bacterium]